MRYRKEDWIQVGFEILKDQGVQAVKVEVIARNLGVTKGGFYGYFLNRDELLESMLDYWEEKYSGEVMQIINDLKGSFANKVQKLLYIIDDDRLSATELSVYHWAGCDHRANDTLMRVAKRRLSWVKSLFIEGGFTPEEAEKRANILHHYMAGCKTFRPLLPDAASPERHEQLDHFLKQLLHQ